MDSTQALPNDLDKFIDLAFRPENPFFISILFVLLLIFVGGIFYKQIFLPFRRMHKLEKGTLIRKNIELISLFTDVNPNPLLRFNELLIIQDINKAALELKDNFFSIGNPLPEGVLKNEIEIKSVIKQGESKEFEVPIDDRYFTCILKGLPQYNEAMLFFYEITELKQNQQRLKKAASIFQSELEAERQRISADLHDSIGQNMYYLKMQINRLMKNGVSEDEIQTEKKQVISLLDNTVNEVKAIAKSLANKNVKEVGLIPSIGFLCDRFKSESGLKAHYEVSGVYDITDEDMNIHLYRFVQEAINNIVKHSKATEFFVRIYIDELFLIVEIEDNGCGFEANEAMQKSVSVNSIGLLSMQHRIERYNGIFSIRSTAGEGTIIKAEIGLSDLKIRRKYAQAN